MRSLLLAGLLLLPSLQANAAPNERISCGVVRGMEFCLIDTMTEDIVMILGPKGGERITIDCSTGVWTAKGRNTQEFAQSAVDLYCSNSN